MFQSRHPSTWRLSETRPLQEDFRCQLEFFILPYLWQHIKTLACLPVRFGQRRDRYKVGAGTRANELQASQTTISQLQAQRANNAEQQAMALADAVATNTSRRS
ncbi:hypothetical protein M8494_20660 [Serratia ureilytica]